MDGIVVDLVVGGIVAFTIVVVWGINRRRGGGQRIDLPTEIVVFGSLLLVAAAIGLYRLGAMADDPAAFVAAVAAIAAILLIALNMFVSLRVRRDLNVVAQRFGEQMAGLGNLQFLPTKEDAMHALTEETARTQEKLIATRFSPADITIEDEYWHAIRKTAFDPSILYTRIHSLAHRDHSSIDGLCRLVQELKGAPRFRLGVAMFNNSFELILVDERECIFCFHDHGMTVRNGFRIEGTQPSSAKIVANFAATLGRMVEDCHIVIDFDRYVRTEGDVQQLQSYLRRLHDEYRNGHIPRPIHHSEMDDFIAETVMARSSR